ncbi:MAG: sigma-70 family RNA polymerase sigma factor [Candidatus Hydrogenedentes bacterium]|nr:sigma-70 family RNA polymerase sigma factor [Candidatus Hydrogenedentota bacterium]
MVLLKDVADSPDAGLVEGFRSGDLSAFEELVRRYKDRIYRVVYRYLGDHEDARDIAQEVFIRAYRGIHTFRGHAQVYTWLYSIASNLARNRLRDQQRKGRNRGTSLEALETTAPGRVSALSSNDCPRTIAQRRELDEGLRQCLDGLPDAYRMAFVLRTFDDMSYEDIAISIGVPRGTVKSRLNQARKRLRDCLRYHHLI